MTTLQTFAANVKQAAALVPSAGRVGSKVWVHAVWALSRSELTLPEFKARLLEANRARLVDLSRCDLVEAFDRYDVRRSTIEAEGATYNFVRV